MIVAMLDLPRLDRIRFQEVPWFQRFTAAVLLQPQYREHRRVRIVLEGADRLPDEPVYLAMNHTDRYNYFPFQYRLFRDHGRYTATWVKGKYYNSAFVGGVMELANQLPVPSRGYVVSQDFVNCLGRKPTSDEYNELRRIVECVAVGEDVKEEDLRVPLPRELFFRRRNILGWDYDPHHHRYLTFVNRLFAAMMDRFVSLNQQAFSKRLHVLVFPQGTRSVRLSRGHIGLAQMALHLKKPIVPIGCSGSDLVHPADPPLCRPGTIVYRIGEAIPYEDMQDWHVGSDYRPFRLSDERREQGRLQGLTDYVMDRINDLVDEPYKYSETRESDGVQGTGRFV